MKKLVFFIAGIAFGAASFAQVQFTRNGKISIFSSTPVEDIKAENNEVISFLDTKKGELKFQVLIKGFIFPKAKMQEHFNSKDYMNSDQFPQAAFLGNIANLKAVNFNKDGTYKVKVTGNLTLHGITKPAAADGILMIVKGAVNAKAVFKITREEYGVIVPAFMGAKIAKDIEITVDCKYAPKK
ncbi:MAG: YceI family protein [Chitinophagaceae bacterium]